MGQEEIAYIRDVLGVRGFARSQDFGPRLEICVWTPFAPDSREREMIQKMLAAVGIQEALYFNQGEHSHDQLEEKIQEVGVRYGLAFGIERPSDSTLKWVELPSVVQFLDNSDLSRLKKIKSEAWTQLKKLKSDLERA